MQYITRVIRVTWHWGHPPLSLGFVRGHKSIVKLLLTINCALKFYNLFMMYNVIWFMWTLWVTHSNCGCFCGLCPHDDLPKPPAARALSAAWSRSAPNTSLLDTSGQKEKSVPARVPQERWGEIQTVFSDTWGRQCSQSYALSHRKTMMDRHWDFDFQVRQGLDAMFILMFFFLFQMY